MAPQRRKKSIRRQRCLRSPQERKNLLESYQTSNLSRRAFCKKYEIAYPTLCLWIRSSLGDEKERGSFPRAQEKGAEFVEVQVDRKPGCACRDKRGAIEVRLPTSIEIRLSKDYTLKEVAELIYQLGVKPC